MNTGVFGVQKLMKGKATVEKLGARWLKPKVLLDRTPWWTSRWLKGHFLFEINQSINQSIIVEIGAISPTPVSPTPISPTYYRLVPFRPLKQNVAKTV